MHNPRMRRGGKRHYRELGKLGTGRPKTFTDEQRAKEQRRLAGIASGKARRAKAKPYGKIARKLAKANLPELSVIASQIKRLNESATRVSN